MGICRKHKDFLWPEQKHKKEWQRLEQGGTTGGVGVRGVKEVKGRTIGAPSSTGLSQEAARPR